MAHAPAQAVVVAPDEPGAAQADGEKQILVISTSGYSRFEISAGDVVALYTGGVEATYAGYQLRCETIRLNQAEQTAQLSGGVALYGPEARLACADLRLDMAAGDVRLTGGVRGMAMLPDGDIGVECGSAAIQLPPGETENIDAARLHMLLDGAVLLTTAAGGRLSAETVEYDGPAGELRAAQGFVAELTQPEADAEKRTPGQLDGLGSSGPVYLTGAALTAQIDAEGVLHAARIELPVVHAAGARLTAASASVIPVGAAVDPVGYALTLEGSPVLAALLMEGQPLTLTAQRLQIDTAGRAAQALRLSGKVHVSGAGINGVTETMLLSPKPEGGYSLAFPGGLRVGADLRELSGAEPLDLDELLRTD